MKKLLPLKGLLLALSLITVSSGLHAMQPEQLSLAEAKARAAQLQRPLLVHFFATWVLPCQWLEKNTFANPEVSDYLKGHYLFVKIDVDEVQGYADKEACGIKYLPSLLIFNASGIVVTRFEETLDAQQMLDVLHKFDTPANRIPAKNQSTVPVARINSTIPVKHSTPNVHQFSADTSEDDPAHLDAQRRPLIQTNQTSAVPASRKMAVQIGVYSSYESVIQQVNYFEKKFYKPVHISSSTKNGQTYYHLIAGPFDSPAPMQVYLDSLQKAGVKAWVIVL